ncbi:Glycosyltransferase involved in cell wall bisynthesis [Salinimicrobium sediminis]|uniref:Glycosyltransferase involved in cell wall bisynthesis n=1 Tax=Salinimicrobium sediminis TaxID=1343891 RepID=A0A285X5N9_9FLAO|nr:glycosyltransferase [Salinimicrobium sediminis]SOC80326.1 Glycosyltransferase involved in cell wall bisynthesis [Salinimicrobium sediminis]
MKVLYIIDTINSSGAERSLTQIAINLKKVKPVFVHIYKGDMLREALEKKGVKVYSLNIEKKYGFKLAESNISKIILAEKPDLIHSTLFRSDMVARRLKKKFPEIPLIGSFVNNSYTPLRYKNQNLLMKLKLWIAYQMDKKSSKLVDFYISNSETIRREEGNALDVEQEKIKVIPRGRDIRKYENLDPVRLQKIKKELGLDNKQVLLNVSRLIPRKAQLDLIRAMPEVLDTFPNSILLIAGHGVCENQLKWEISKLSLEENVKLLGRRLDIPYLLEICDLFLYPSYAEGLPGALIEAMMSGKTIICSDIGENLECVNEESAIIFKKGNINELQEKMKMVLADGPEFKYMGENARRQAYRKFDIAMVVNQYEEFYETVMNKSK